MLCRARLAGVAVALLAAAATLGLKAGLLCYGDVCTQEMLLLNRPLSAWGLTVYTLSAMAFLFAPRLILVPWAAIALLAHGAAYLSDPVPCPVCVGTLLADGLLLILAARTGPEYRSALPQAAVAVVAAALAVAVLVPSQSPAYHGPVLDRGAEFYAHGKAESPGNEPPAQEPPSAAGPVALQGEERAEPVFAPLADGPAGAETHSVRLLSPDGTALSVDLRASPVVVFSPACGHCGGVLKAVSAMAEKPVVASTRTEGASEKLAAAGLSGVEWYVLAEESPRGVPALIFWDGRREVALGASAVLNALDNQKGGA